MLPRGVGHCQASSRTEVSAAHAGTGQDRRGATQRWERRLYYGHMRQQTGGVPLATEDGKHDPFPTT